MLEIPGFFVNIIFLSLPQSLACLLAAMIVLGKKLHGAWPRIILFLLIFSPFCFTTTLWAYEHNLFIPRFIVYSAVTVLLVRLIIIPDYKRALRITTFFIVFIVLSGLAASVIAAIAFPGADYILKAPAPVIIWSRWPVCAVLVLLAILFRYSKSGNALLDLRPSYALREYPQLNILFLLQFSLVAGALQEVAKSASRSQLDMDTLVMLAGFLLFFASSMAIMYAASRLARQVVFQDSQADLAEQIQQLVNDCKGQRHDFVHHMSLINALFQAAQYEELLSYISDLRSQYSIFSKTLKPENPFISAMLNAKMLDAEKMGVQMDINVDSSLKNACIERHSLYLARILSRMIDCAMQQLQMLEESERWLILNVEQRKDAFVFLVSNPLSDEQPASDTTVMPGGIQSLDSWDKQDLAGIKTIVREIGARLEFSCESGLIMRWALYLPYEEATV